MFSTAVTEGGPATATRSRRRQRPKSQENLVPEPKAKRQRIPLTEQTFVNPDAAQPEPVMAPTNKSLPVEAIREMSIENVDAHPRKELHVRAKKSKHPDRAAQKGDGSVVLSNTNAYIVSKLPAVPDRIRSDWSIKQHADISSAFGYALTLTPTTALVWPYNSISQSPETFSFTLRTPSRSTEPLPVGCFVSPSASSTEPGLVVVTASTGKVIFWESISSAATFAFIKKDRSGVEHSISGMSHAENVVAITSAESAGFVLTLNSGRLAYLNVRDNHGRPAISVQFLRSNFASVSGIFGSIRHAFSNLSLRGDIAAVRADRWARLGERSIVALTTKGKLQAWRLHRGGHNEHIAESEMSESLYDALYEADPYTKDFSPDSLETLDFTFVPTGLESKYLDMSRLSDAMGIDDTSIQHLLLLVSLSRNSVARYSLVEVILQANSAKIGMIRPITSYSAPLPQPGGAAAHSPRLYLPRPALVAFVVFERAAVMASLALPPESPDAQLQSDNQILPPSFEDVIDFREDDMFEIIGSGFEEMSSITPEDNRVSRQQRTAKNPSVLLMVRGAGVIRVITTDIDKFASEQPPQVSAKSKLEQTIFFGGKKESPLVFDGRREADFSAQETSQAALDVSQDILSSAGSHMASSSASLEENLRARSASLERLIFHLQAIGADMDRKTRWTLLYNAEKMHVATMLWKRHEAFTAARPADDKKSLIGSIVDFIHEDQKSNPIVDAGQVDAVRHWFIHDVFRLEIFIAWAYEVIKTLYKDQLLSDAKITRLINEAIQINVVAHFGALEFRKDNLSTYGLGHEQMRLGIIRDNYEGMPEPWTGCHYISNNIKRLLDLSDQWYGKQQALALGKAQGPGKSNVGILTSIFDKLPSLADAALTSVLEFARWGAATVEHKAIAQSFAEVYATDRFEKSVFLARAGKWEEAALLAEKHQSLHGLAVILLDHVEALEQQLAHKELPAAQAKSLRALRDTKKAQLEDRFSRYGKDFAFPVYEYLLEKHGVEAVLDFELETIGFKTQFLRSKPELARISWINDIEQEHDVDHAANSLVDLALTKEQQVWNKKVELSLGKLALLAEAEQKETQAIGFKLATRDGLYEEQMAKVDKELITLKIQDQLYSQIFPSTYDAVDEAAALNFAMEAHSANIPRRQKGLLQLFQDGVERLLRHEALDAMTLIDLLTLISLKPGWKDEIAHPFWMALKVAESSSHADEAKEAKRLIWRRLFIRDDWARINDTQLKHDREVMDQLAETELFAVLADCVRYQDERDPFRPMSPQEALGAFTRTLDRRFGDLGPEFCTRQAEAMKWEDKALTLNIDKYRLADWLRTCLAEAQSEVQLQSDEAAAMAMAKVVDHDDEAGGLQVVASVENGDGDGDNGHVPGSF